MTMIDFWTHYWATYNKHAIYGTEGNTNTIGEEQRQKKLWSTLAGTADDAVSMMGPAVDGDLQTVMSIVSWADLSSGLNCNRNPITYIYAQLPKMVAIIPVCFPEQEFSFSWPFPLTLLGIWRNSPLLSYILHTRPLTPPWHKRWISSVLDDDFIRYFPRSCKSRCTINI